jgi:hypothetical protein
MSSKRHVKGPVGNHINHVEGLARRGREEARAEQVGSQGADGRIHQAYILKGGHCFILSVMRRH